MINTTILGYPRIGLNRELKKALENYWKGALSAEVLQETAQQIRRKNWQTQHRSGIKLMPSNDFSFYDHVLDTAVMLGAVPSRYGWHSDTVDLDTYFAMARGVQDATGQDVAAMEMTKWFDTNYHYIVPEFQPGQTFRLGSNKPLEHYLEAKTIGFETRPVLLGPVSFLLLGKSLSGAKEPLAYLSDILPIYTTVLNALGEAGAEWVQIDEPYLALDLTDNQKMAFRNAYTQLGTLPVRPKILLTVYFEGYRDNLDLVGSLPVEGVHLDLVRAPGQLPEALTLISTEKILALGLVDGRDIWITDLDKAYQLALTALENRGADKIWIGSSCSLMHVPLDLSLETQMDSEVKQWLAFACQKLDEISALGQALNKQSPDSQPLFNQNRQAQAAMAASEKVHDKKVAERLGSTTKAMRLRSSTFAARQAQQQHHLNLPQLPTTTIGSFPQTREVRRARADLGKKIISETDYEGFIKWEIENAIRLQEKLELDVLVHGEFERNDMVQYFAEQMQGFVFTQAGWVQSFGSRYVRPPIIFGDVSRPEPMTVRWSRYAQSLTDKPVKGMLTGPVTILKWSFVRDDQPLETTCRQIALAIRDEVQDLETAGIGIIQIDEPALREGLPLRRADWQAYLDWAVDSFRLASAGVQDQTQIHTHMCYAEFNDIIDSIAALDADVISIEASRSKMELMQAFTDYEYPNEIGPGVYDIHSPRVPSESEMIELLDKALEVLLPEQLWVNPDCGLKTRGWVETENSLKNMVRAAQTVRRKIKDKVV
jgi:5-methyltetrahydropteroyltriglutamate--homocysteine methyltransferase